MGSGGPIDIPLGAWIPLLVEEGNTFRNTLVAFNSVHG